MGKHTPAEGLLWRGSFIGRSLSRRFGQRLIKIGDQVGGILCPDGNAHNIRAGARGFLLLGAKLTVRGGGRVDDQ